MKQKSLCKINNIGTILTTLIQPLQYNNNLRIPQFDF